MLSRIGVSCFAVFSLPLMLAGCGGISAGSPLLMSCDVRTSSGQYAGQCHDWRGDVMDSTNASVNFASVCASTLGGTMLDAACPTDMAVGLCSKTPSVAKRLVQITYFAPTFDRTTAETNCKEQQGSFTAK